jgi:hypothetical protein
LSTDKRSVFVYPSRRLAMTVFFLRGYFTLNDRPEQVDLLTVEEIRERLSVL